MSFDLKVSKQGNRGDNARVARTEAPVAQAQPVPSLQSRSWAGPAPRLSAPLAGRFGATAMPVQRSILRGEARQSKAAVGKPPPTMVHLLTARFEDIASESGIEPSRITKKAVRLYTAAVAAPPPLTHPLARRTDQEAVQQAIHTEAAHAATNDVTVFKQIVAGNAMGTLIQQGDDPNADVMLGVVSTELDPYVAQAEIAFYTNPARMKNAEIRNLVTGLAGALPGHQDLLEQAAASHLAAEARAPIAELDGDQKRQLIAALESMPIVKAMYSGKLRDMQTDASVNLKSLEVLPTALSQEHFAKYQGPFADELHDGMFKYSALVEPDRRPPDDRISKVEVNPDTVKSNGWFRKPTIEPFRANANRENDRVRLSITDKAHTVVHEMGHQTEFHLPTSEWVDIQQILHMRHQGGNLIDIYGNGKEPAYNASMPAFEDHYGPQVGKYGAKVYASGDTEVTSMTMEFFSQPETARKMIQLDPLVAATVLRAIRPNDFEAHIPQDLQDLLPRGRGALAHLRGA